MFHGEGDNRRQPSGRGERLKQSVASAGEVAGKIEHIVEIAPVVAGETVITVKDLITVLTVSSATKAPVDLASVNADFQMAAGAIVGGALLDRLFVHTNEQFQNRLEQFLGRVQYQGVGALLARAIGIYLQEGRVDWRYSTAGLAILDEVLARVVTRKGEGRKSMPAATRLREGIATGAAFISGYGSWQLWQEGDKVGSVLLGVVALANFGEAWSNAPRFETVLPMVVLNKLEERGKHYEAQLTRVNKVHVGVLRQTRRPQPVGQRLFDASGRVDESVRKATAWGLVLDQLNEIGNSSDYAIHMKDLDTAFTRKMQGVMGQYPEFRAEFLGNWDRAVKNAETVAKLMTFAREWREHMLARAERRQSLSAKQGVAIPRSGQDGLATGQSKEFHPIRPPASLRPVPRPTESPGSPNRRGE